MYVLSKTNFKVYVENKLSNTAFYTIMYLYTSQKPLFKKAIYDIILFIMQLENFHALKLILFSCSYLIETKIMAKIKYFPKSGTTRLVGGMISTTKRKNTWRLMRIEIAKVT